MTTATPTKHSGPELPQRSTTRACIDVLSQGGGSESSRRRPKVRLNGQWRQFSAPKRDLIMLGTIQCGQEIGALARTPDGSYVQLNGSVIRTLKTSLIKAALARATQELSARLASEAAQLAPPPPPSAHLQPARNSGAGPAENKPACGPARITSRQYQRQSTRPVPAAKDCL